MRIIESGGEETTLPEVEVLKPEKPQAETKSEKNSPQKEMFNIAKDIHELGNKLMELASKL